MRSLLGAAAAAVLSLGADSGQPEPPDATSVLDFTVTDIDGNDVAMDSYRGNVLFIVNVASRCGYTGQYEQLTELDETYREQGLRVLGFPSNDFMGQEPGSDEDIKIFCQTKYDVAFDMFSKIKVKGRDADPLYAFLISEETNPEFGGRIGWNFTKFLVNRNGDIIARYNSGTRPDDPEVVAAIEAALAEEAATTDAK